MTVPHPSPSTPSRSFRRLSYFDAAGGAVAAAVLVRAATVTSDPDWRWTAWRVAVLLALAAMSLAVAAMWPRAARGDSPWLAGAFSAAAAAAVATLFWPIHVLSFVVVMLVAGAALVAGFVLRSRSLFEPPALIEVFSLAAIALGILLAVFTVEAGLRLAPGVLSPAVRQMVSADPTQYGVAHPYIGYLHRPNGAPTVEGKDFKAVHKVDDKGFRNARPWPARADIVVVGDSVSFGYGVAGEQAWPTIVAGARPDLSLVNLSLVGAGPQQYLRVYETFGTSLKPRLLLVGVFASNDFWDAETFDLWLKSGAEGNFMVWRDFGRPGPETFSLRRPVQTLRSAFDRHVYPLLRTSRIYNLLRALHGGRDGDLGRPVYFTCRDGKRLQLRPDEFSRTAALGAAGNRAFQLALDALSRLHDLAEQNGTRVLMVLQPGKEEVYLPLVDGRTEDPARPLRAAFTERGIEYLDLAPAFRERAAAGERLFFEEDGHPNPDGYAFIANLVLSHLERMGHEYGLEESGTASERPRGNMTTATQSRW
jgi:acetyltransferase AlgX (SGNH hydrolase-like protein)